MPSFATVVTVISPLVSFLQNKRQFTALAATVVLCLSLYVANVVPIDQFELQLGTLSGRDWKAEGVRLKVRWEDGRSGSFSLSASRLTHAMLPFPLLSPGIQCGKGVVDDHLVQCEQGRLEMANPLLDNDSFPVKFSWERAEQKFSIVMERVGLAGGRLDLHLDGKAEDWNLKADGRNMSIAQLRKKLSTLGLTLPKSTTEGRVDLVINLVGGQIIQSANWNLNFQQVAFSDAGSSFIGEGLFGRWHGNMQAARRGYNGNTRLALRRGALLTPFFYLEPGGDEIEIAMNYHLDNAFKHLVFEQFKYLDPQVMAFSAGGNINLFPDLQVGDLKIRSQPVELDKVYRKYLQPVLANEFLETLSLHGGAQFEFELGSISKLNLELNDLTIRHGSSVVESGRDDFHLSGLSGKLFWSSGDSVARSSLNWRDGELLRGIKIGSGEMFLKLLGSSVQLDEPASIPVLDGELRAERFSVNQTKAGSRIDFQGYITPISMKLISEALGWPPLAGQLSGMIPGVSLEDGLLKLRGITLIRAFDGTILLKNLRLDDLFGALPVLQADVEVKAVDLETLTATFSFGKITGRLAGRINSLRLEQWRPVAFDAWFATPENDPGPHRISQKAVDNISNLGGVGISGALSRSFLRIFEEFGYAKLGISCRLEKRVCDMGGIEPTGPGYYLVKGGGLPRIDIIGFNRKTDWSVLVDKLKQIAEGGSPVIQ